MDNINSNESSNTSQEEMSDNCKTLSFIDNCQCKTCINGPCNKSGDKCEKINKDKLQDMIFLECRFGGVCNCDYYEKKL